MSKQVVKNLKLKQLTESIKNKGLLPINKLGRRLRDIREALGITQKQMAKRLKVNQSVVSRIEENIESSTLKTISRIVNALECELMGAIISKEPLEQIIQKRAEIAAKKMLNRTFSNMALEKQSPNKDAYKFQLNKLTNELASDPGPELWED